MPFTPIPTRSPHGICTEAVRAATHPILGVCLGHQGICHLHGGTVRYADEVMHAG